MFHFGMRDDVIVRKPRINLRLEDLNFLACDFCATQPSNQFFGLAGEHGTGNHFNPAGARQARVFSARGHFIFLWLDTANHFCCGAHFRSFEYSWRYEKVTLQSKSNRFISQSRARGTRILRVDSRARLPCYFVFPKPPPLGVSMRTRSPGCKSALFFEVSSSV